jgi:hypothetical protein
MTAYQMIEISNMQQFRDGPHMALTPRIECVSGETYTNLNDFKSVFTASETGGEIVFEARGQLMTASRQPPPSGDLRYHMTYRLSETEVEIAASTSGAAPAGASMRLVVPVIARSVDRLDSISPQSVRIVRTEGTITIRTDSAAGFEPSSKEKTFNLVPGFEAFPISVALPAEKAVRIQLRAELKAPTDPSHTPRAAASRQFT